MHIVTKRDKKYLFFIYIVKKKTNIDIFKFINLFLNAIQLCQ